MKKGQSNKKHNIVLGKNIEKLLNGIKTGHTFREIMKGKGIKEQIETLKILFTFN